MSSEIIASLVERHGDRKVHFDRDDADDFPWLFEPYWEADLDLAIERASLRVLDGTLDLALVADVVDHRRGDQRVAAFQRVVRGRTAWHRSSLTYEPFQRQGIARRQLSASVALYDALDIDRVQLNAVGPGRYVWARAGFDFAERVLDDSAPEPAAVALLRALAERVLDDSAPEPAAVARLRALAERLGHDLGATTCSWEIAGRQEEVPPGLFVARGGSTRFLGSPADCEGPLGRVLLLCAGVGDWDGVLDLATGSPGRTQFERYCRAELVD